MPDLLKAIERMNLVFSKELPIDVEELCAKHPELAARAAEALVEFTAKMENLHEELVRKLILQLRDRTSLPLMKCKWALIQADNDIDRAIQLLWEETRRSTQRFYEPQTRKEKPEGST